MKKLIGIFAVLLMVCGLTGLASASTYFDTTSSLMMTVYNPTTNATAGPDEVGISLTDLSTFNLAYTDNYTLVAANAFSPSDFTGTPAFSGLNAAVYGVLGDPQSTRVAYFATTTSTVPTLNSRGQDGFTAGSEAAGSYYDLLSGNSTQIVKGSTAYNGGSFWNAFDNSAVGYMGGFSVDTSVNEANLAALANGSDVIMYLWSATLPGRSGTSTVIGNAPLAKVKIASNGDVYMSTVPVPGAIWLLGSALLGVVGLRKKNA